jgi:hypothetical protein
VGREIFITPHIDEVYTQTKRILDADEPFQIPPEQFAFILTEEKVTVPAEAMAFISMKATYKMQGLINVSGFHVDPGWDGPLIFAVFNAGPSPVHLQRGYRIQADAAGHLDPATSKLLDRLARDEILEIPLPELRAIKPGTLLVREWDGTLQRVMVLESGFACNGARTRACPRSPARSRERIGPPPGSSGCAIGHDHDQERACSCIAPRDLYPCLNRAWARAGVQLARQPARRVRGLHQEPGP